MAHMWTELVAAATPYWHAFIAAATSWLAWRIYVLSAAAAIAVASIWYAQRQSANFYQIKPRRGPPAKIQASIKKDLDKLKRQKRQRTAIFLTRALTVVGFGFGVPSMLLLFGIDHYGWFRPGVEPLLSSSGCGVIAAHPAFWDTAQFVASQLTMGITDGHLSVNLLTGTSNLHSTATLIPSESIVRGLVISYRYYIGVFTTLIIRLGLSTFKALTATEQMERDLRARLVNAG